MVDAQNSKKLFEFSNKNEAANKINISFYIYFLAFIFFVLSFLLISPLVSLASAFLFFAYIFSLSSERPLAFVFLLPLIGLWSTEIVSLVAIEFGAYMHEVGITGEATGAGSRLAFVYIFLLSVVGLFFSSKFDYVNARKITESARAFPHKKYFYALTLLISAIYVLYLFYVGLLFGFPLLDGSDRLTYRVAIEDPLFNSVINNRPIAIAIISILYLLGYRYTSNIIVACFFAISILFSEKFTSLILMGSFFTVPYFIDKISKDGALKLSELMRPFLVIATISTPTILYIYGADTDFSLALQKLLDRFSVQGQMWFVIDRDFFSVVDVDISSIANEISSWIFLSSQNSTSAGVNFGRFYVMQHYVGNELLLYMIEYDQGYVFTLFPSWLASGGLIWVLLLSGALGLLLAIFIKLSIDCFVKSNYILLVLLNKAYLLIISGVISGYSYQVFGLKVLFLLAGIAVVLWSKKYANTNKI